VDAPNTQWGGVSSLALAPDRDSPAAALVDWWTTGYVERFDCARVGGQWGSQSVIQETTYADAAGLAISSTGVPHVSYVDYGTHGPLKHACCNSTTWVKDTVLNGSISLLGGIGVLGELPIVAFYEPGAGICVASMLPPGVADQPQTTRNGSRVSSIIRGVLLLPEATTHKPQAASLLDISGRKVMDLEPGANDARALAPGVYFVRQASSVRHQASSVSKVVLTE